MPPFVEELTKMVLESGLLEEQEERYALTSALPSLAIPIRQRRKPAFVRPLTSPAVKARRPWS
jgi:hypothetical protein